MNPFTSKLDQCPFAHDIMYEIFEFFLDDTPMLFRLLFVHSSYQEYVERLLYRNRADWIYFPFPRVNKGFLTAVINSPRLASYVHSYAIIEAPSRAAGFEIFKLDDQAYNSDVSSFWAAALTAIGRMTNLKSFILQIIPLVGAGDLLPCSSFLSILSTKQLVTFKWNAEPSQLLSFLSTQLHLQNLHIRVVSMGPLKLKKFDRALYTAKYLPDLRRFSGDRDAIEAFMPRNTEHRVSALTWEGQSSLNVYHAGRLTHRSSSNTPKFPESIETLESLAIQIGGIPEVVQTQSRNLRCLQIEYAAINVEEIIDAAFPLLECIVFTGVESIQSVDQSTLVSLSVAAPSLRAIYAGPLKDPRPMKPKPKPTNHIVFNPKPSGVKNFTPKPKYTSTTSSSQGHRASLPQGFWSQLSAGMNIASQIPFGRGSTQYSTSSSIRQGISSFTTTLPGISIQNFNSQMHSSTSAQTTFSHEPETQVRAKIDYPNIEAPCVTEKYGCWLRKKVIKDGVETDQVVMEVKTIQRSLFSGDLLQDLWPTH